MTGAAHNQIAGKRLVPTLAPSGGVVEVEIDLGAMGAAIDLPYAPERYFHLPAGCVTMPLARLVMTRARAKGVANAGRLMLAAYEGRQERRAPVSVQPLPDGRFLVLDGNSTTLTALASGWTDIPCSIEPDAAVTVR
jgi:hypothetical protein